MKENIHLKENTHHPTSINGLDHLAARWIMSIVGNPRIAIRLWNGNEFYFADGAPVGVLEFLNRSALAHAIVSPRVGFGEGYSKGRIEIHGDILELLNEVSSTIAKRSRGNYYFGKFRSRLRAIRGNTLRRSKDNVHHHYDLGNDFYRMWLDENMVYTCAYYAHPDLTLAEAQVAKMDHVCRKLELKPGQEVIEAGCGWGALAMHMAEHYGVNVKAYNNSREQVRYAREQAEARGLTSLVEFVEEDYRKISDRCDVFVSVGMLEHVGLRNYQALGRLIDRCLRPSGRGLIHSIGRSHPCPTDPWISKRIFPGGYIPSLGDMSSIFERPGFSILDVENLRFHYARTCREWLQRFEKVSDRVRDIYGDEFVRAWRLYLAGSSTGFQSGSLQLYQVVFAPPQNRDVPWSRHHLYAGQSRGE